MTSAAQELAAANTALLNVGAPLLAVPDDLRAEYNTIVGAAALKAMVDALDRPRPKRYPRCDTVEMEESRRRIQAAVDRDAALLRGRTCA